MSQADKPAAYSPMVRQENSPPDCFPILLTVIHAVDPGLALLDHLRLKTAIHCPSHWNAVSMRGAVAGDVNGHRPFIPLQRFARRAVALIRLRRDAVPKGCPFLFPGDVPGQPVVDLKRFWERMRVQADIPDVRIHDLRHTFASLLVSGGASLEMIGRLLGHTQIGTTQRYAHLIDPPLRAGVNAVGEMLKPRLKVVGGRRDVW
jgi:hypothetical protein